MAKRKPDEPAPGSPAWMSTFSDLMNLLLCFFVMLFSMSTISEDKLNQLVASMQSAFSIFEGGATSLGEGILLGNGISQLNELDQYINSTGKAADSVNDSSQLDDSRNGGQTDADGEMQAMAEALEAESLRQNEQLSELVAEAVSESNMADQIEVSFTAQYVQLSLRGALLFDSGRAEIKAESEKILDKVGVILERYADSTIEIEGHTDNVPVGSGSQFANNNELSSARALSVFDYLLEHTSLSPATIKHSGCGEYHPVADNSTEAGRAKNRRVEIKIYHSAA